MRFAHASGLCNNEALAREGIDTFLFTPHLDHHRMRNNEALAREGIDTPLCLLLHQILFGVTMRH